MSRDFFALQATGQTTFASLALSKDPIGSRVTRPDRSGADSLGDPAIFGTPEAPRFGHVALPFAIPHPWCFPDLTALLDCNLRTLDRYVYDEPPEAFEARIAAIDLEARFTKAQAERETKKASFGVVGFFHREKLSPSDVFVRSVPIAPPWLREDETPDEQASPSRPTALARLLIMRTQRYVRLRDLAAPEILSRNEATRLRETAFDLLTLGAVSLAHDAGFTPEDDALVKLRFHTVLRGPDEPEDERMDPRSPETMVIWNARGLDAHTYFQRVVRAVTPERAPQLALVLSGAGLTATVG